MTVVETVATERKMEAYFVKKCVVRRGIRGGF